MSREIVIDLETMGTAPGSLIVSIGAVACRPGEEEWPPECEFYRRIDWTSGEELGLKLEAETVKWWLEQSDAAREEITWKAGHILAVLTEFGCWLRQMAPGGVWGNGATFDLVLLRCAYAAAGYEPPWHWRDERCYRTLRKVLGRPRVEVEGLKHHALEDARAEARDLCEMLKILECDC
ncbi:MAG: 3'-5' exoribonuclease [Nitrospirota bacterium]|nr:3'-5' exoribonuclease [Nitrospirota bacterium]